MEKYRKFDDPSCGINPFMPLIEQKRPLLVKIVKLIIVPLFIVIKIPFIFILLTMLFILNILKHVLIVPVLIRILERIQNFFLCKILLTAFGVNNFRGCYH